MPVDYYPNLTVPELEVLLAQAQTRKAKGAVVSVSVPGMFTTRDLGNSRNDPEREIRDILYSLFLKAGPTLYANPYAQRITRTRTRYVQAQEDVTT